MKRKCSEKSFPKLSQPLEVALILKIWMEKKLSAYFRTFSFFSPRDLEFEDSDVSSLYTTRKYSLNIFQCPQQVLVYPFWEKRFHVFLVGRRGSWIAGIERLGNIKPEYKYF